MRVLFPLGLLLAVAAFARADLMKELSTADQERLKSGEQVVTTEPLDGYPWPRVSIYQYLPATPREVMATFTDYDHACAFVPNCLKSKIAKKVGPLAYDVDYLIDVPILSDEAYTVCNTLSEAPGGALRVSWSLIKATSILETKGNLYVEPDGEKASILRYTNLVKPSSGAAVILRGVALSQMKSTVKAIVAQVEKQQADPATQKPLLDRLDASLAGK